MYSVNLFKSRLTYMGTNQKELAHDMGISEAAMYKKSNTGNFRRWEIEKMAELLELEPMDIIHIFFA